MEALVTDLEMLELLDRCFPGQVVRRKEEAAGALPAREQQGQCCPVKDGEAGAVHPSQSCIPCYPNTESHGLAKSFAELMALRQV